MDIHGDQCDLNHIDVSKVTNMSYLFCDSSFDGDISNWKPLKLKFTEDMFYLCAKPKLIYYKRVKTMIDEVYKSKGVVTELLPKQAISRILIKEASH